MSVDPQTLVEMQDRFDEIIREGLWEDLYERDEERLDYAHDEDEEEVEFDPGECDLDD